MQQQWFRILAIAYGGDWVEIQYELFIINEKIQRKEQKNMLLLIVVIMNPRCGLLCLTEAAGMLMLSVCKQMSFLLEAGAGVRGGQGA
jgi:hypothetical protein